MNAVRDRRDRWMGYMWLLLRDEICPFCDNRREVIAMAADPAGRTWAYVCRNCFSDMLVEVGREERVAVGRPGDALPRRREQAGVDSPTLPLAGTNREGGGHLG